MGIKEGRVRLSLTSNHLWALKVLIGMYVAGGDGKVKPHKQEEEIGPSPHGWPWSE